MIIIRIQDLVLLHKNLPKIPLKVQSACHGAENTPRFVAMLLSRELNSEIGLANSVRIHVFCIRIIHYTGLIKLYTLLFSYHLSIEFLHTPTKNMKHWWHCRQVGDYNEKHVTRPRYSPINPPKGNFRFDCKKREILYRLCICSCNIWQWSSVWEKKSILILRFFPFKIWQWSSVGEKKILVSSYCGKTKVMTNASYYIVAYAIHKIILRNRH